MCGRIPHCIFQSIVSLLIAITFKKQFVIIVLELFGMYSTEYMPETSVHGTMLYSCTGKKVKLEGV